MLKKVWMILLLMGFQCLAAPIQNNSFDYARARDFLTDEEFEQFSSYQVLDDSENGQGVQKRYFLLPKVQVDTKSIDVTYDAQKVELLRRIDEQTALLIKRLYNTELGQLDYMELSQWNVNADELDVERKMLLHFWKSEVLSNLEQLGYTFSVDADYDEFIARILEIKEQTFAVVSFDVRKTYPQNIRALVSKLNDHMGDTEILYYGADFPSKVWNKGTLFGAEVGEGYQVANFYTEYSNSFRTSGQIQLGVNYTGLKSVLESDTLEMKKLPLQFQHTIEGRLKTDLELDCKIDQNYVKKIQNKVIKLPSGRVDISATPASLGGSRENSLSACHLKKGHDNEANRFMATMLEQKFKEKFSQMYAMSDHFKRKLINNALEKEGEFKRTPIVFYEVLKRFPVQSRSCWNVVHTRQSCWKIFGWKVKCRTDRWTTHHCKDVTNIVERLERHNKLTQFSYMADIKANIGLHEHYKISGDNLVRFDVLDEKILDLKEL